MSRDRKYHPAFLTFEQWCLRHTSLTEAPPDPNSVLVEFFLEFRNFDDRDVFIRKIDPVWKNPFSPEQHTPENGAFLTSSEKNNIDSTRCRFIGAFRHFPAVWTQASYQWINEQIEDPLIIRIHPNLPFYLCMNQVNTLLNSDLIANSFYSFDGTGIRIALIDSGVDSMHPDIVNRIEDVINLTTEDDRDLNGHGTMMAGIVMGSGAASDHLFHGVAPGARVLSIKAFQKDGRGWLGEILLALDLIADRDPTHQPHLIVFGGTAAVEPTEDDILSYYCRQLVDQNIGIIAPTGNFGPDPGFIPPPAAYSTVLSIGAMDFNNQITFFTGRMLNENESESGKFAPRLFLPGVNVVAPKSLKSVLGPVFPTNSNYLIVTGTSPAAAIAAGIYALIKQAFPTDPVNQIYEKLTIREPKIPDLIALLTKHNLFYPKPLRYKNLFKLALGFACGMVGLCVGLYCLLRYLL
jgi:hypothetical protein